MGSHSSLFVYNFKHVSILYECLLMLGAYLSTVLNNHTKFWFSLSATLFLSHDRQSSHFKNFT